MLIGIKSLLIIACLQAPAFSLHADQIILDQNLSPGVSSTNLIFLDNRLMELQNQYKDEKHNSFIKADTADFFDPTHYYLNGPYYFSESFGRRLLKATLRSAEIGLVWGPLSYATTVVQHEIFGHGYRIRDLGSKKVKLNKYTIKFQLTPLGLGLKEASTGYHYNPETYNHSDSLLMAIGGMEANSILAHNVIMSWLNKGQIDGRQAVLWNYAYMDQFNYIFSTRWVYNFESAIESGHDILNYVATLNYIYSQEDSLRGQLNNLESRVLLAALFNPFTYLSSYSTYSYIFFNSAVSIPSIQLGEYHFLPAYRLGLTPFGPEDIIEMFYWSEGLAPIYAYWKQGEFSLNKYVGLGLECQNMVLTKMGDFGLKLDLWHQPHMLTRVVYDQKGYTHQELFGKHLGGALSLFFQKALQNDSNKNIWLQLGYKTKGFLPGETYKQAPIVKVGMQTQF